MGGVYKTISTRSRETDLWTARSVSLTSKVTERAASKRSVRERLTKSPLSSVRRSQKQLASASTN